MEKRLFFLICITFIFSVPLFYEMKRPDPQGKDQCCKAMRIADAADKVTQAFPKMPGPGKKVPIGNGHYMIYGFDKRPKMGTVIMKVEIYTKEGRKDTSMEVKADAGMPSMRGAHETGERAFTLSKKGDYLLPIDIVMPGDWEIRLTILQKGSVIFRGRYNFDV